jgi:hypothetical protein
MTPHARVPIGEYPAGPAQICQSQLLLPRQRMARTNDDNAHIVEEPFGDHVGRLDARANSIVGACARVASARLQLVSTARSGYVRARARRREPDQGRARADEKIDRRVFLQRYYI